MRKIIIVVHVIAICFLMSFNYSFADIGIDHAGSSGIVSFYCSTRDPCSNVFDEFNKMEISAKQIDSLASLLNYKDSIYIFFDYDIGINSQKYLISFDKIKFPYFMKDTNQENKNVLNIEIIANTVNPKELLKIAEYGINNLDQIIKNQSEIPISRKWHSSYFVTSIEPSVSDSIVNSEDSEEIKKLISEKVHLQTRLFNHNPNKNFRYYYQNGLFHICFIEQKNIENISEKDYSEVVMSLPDLYQLNSLSNHLVVFDTDTTFYYYNHEEKKITSKQTIKYSKSHNWCDCKTVSFSGKWLWFGKDKIYIEIGHCGIRNYKPRKLIYDIEKDELFQDLENDK